MKERSRDAYAIVARRTPSREIFFASTRACVDRGRALSRRKFTASFAGIFELEAVSARGGINHARRRRAS
jgi:hypothetical protein